MLSQGTYGAKVAVPLILDVLARQEVSATFFVPGRVAERYPDRVREILAAGHEVAHHGYTHTSPADLSREAEEAELERGLEALRAVGADPVGYRSPAWEFSPNTIELLEAHGFAYSSNYMDDIRPYRHPGTEIVELPVQWILDDAPHFWFSGADWNRKIATVSEVREIWTGELDGIVKLGGSCIFTMHPQVIGRPHRIAFLEEIHRRGAEPSRRLDRNLRSDRRVNPIDREQLRSTNCRMLPMVQGALAPAWAFNHSFRRQRCDDLALRRRWLCSPR